MTLLLSIFYSSLLALFGLVVHQWYEDSTGAHTMVARVLGVVDQHVRVWYYAVRRFVSHINLHNAERGALWCLRKLIVALHSLYYMMHRRATSHPRSQQVISMVTGRGTAASPAGSSLYMKTLSVNMQGMREARAEGGGRSKGVQKPL
jgi:hypothetical protein